MKAGLFHPFWIPFTAVLTLALWLFLFPRMLDRWGPAGALLGSVGLLVGMTLAYIRGYWVSRWLSGHPGSQGERPHA